MSVRNFLLYISGIFDQIQRAVNLVVVVDCDLLFLAFPKNKCHTVTVTNLRTAIYSSCACYFLCASASSFCLRQKDIVPSRKVAVEV